MNSMKNKIFQALVVDRKEKTAAQLAAQLNTSTKSVAARISELRDEGYSIYANQRTDSSNRTKTFYRHGSPTRATVAAGRLMQKIVRQVA